MLSRVPTPPGDSLLDQLDAGRARFTNHVEGHGKEFAIWIVELQQVSA